MIGIEFTPGTQNIAKGKSSQLTVTGTYTNGQTQTLTSGIDFNSSDVSVATVDASGKVMAVKEGMVTIGAKSGTFSSQTTVTVVMNFEDINMTIVGERGLAGRLLAKNFKHIDGSKACTQGDEECKLSTIFETAPCSGSLESIENYNFEEIVDYVTTHKESFQDFNSTKQLIYGGVLKTTIVGFSSSDIKLRLEAIMCGRVILQNGNTKLAGFANPGHSAFALIKVKDQPYQHTSISVMDENGDFSLDLSGINLGKENEIVEIMIFSIRYYQD